MEYINFIRSLLISTVFTFLFIFSSVAFTDEPLCGNENLDFLIKQDFRNMEYNEDRNDAGIHFVHAWDGKDKNGIQQPDGYYTVLVSGKDASGNLVEVEHLMTGKVSGAGVDNGIVKLFVGNGLNIEQEKILSVRKAEASLEDEKK